MADPADGRFAGKVAFITGGAYGIGRVYGQSLAAEGAAIAIADMDAERTAATVAEFASDGHTAIGVTCDVADEHAVDDAVARTIAELGGIDILVNNAGAHLKEYSQPPITEMPRERWRRAVDVNLHGPVNCAAAVRPSMEQRGGGVIVNQLTIAAYSEKGGAYSVTKFAARGLVAVLAAELAPVGVRVYGIAPGLVDSEAALASMTEEEIEAVIDQQAIKRLGRMSDCAKTLIFLCSDDASFITGETIIVGGGAAMRM